MSYESVHTLVERMGIIMSSLLQRVYTLPGPRPLSPAPTSPLLCRLALLLCCIVALLSGRAEAQTQGDVRIADTATGRIEIYDANAGTWKPVCDDYWSKEDVRVACRQMGLGEAGGTEVEFLSGGGPDYFLDNVRCTGAEATLLECPREGNPALGEHNCGGDYDENAGVVCTGSIPTNLQATPGEAQVTLEWGTPSDSQIARYQYQQRADSGTTENRDWTNIPGSGASTTSYTVPDLTPGTTYTFQVRIYNQWGPGSESDPVSAQPTPPEDSDPGDIGIGTPGDADNKGDRGDTDDNDTDDNGDTGDTGDTGTTTTGTPGGGPGGGDTQGDDAPPAPVGYLENPGPDSFQSGIGLISGWVCEADAVEIEIETAGGAVLRYEAAYGTERADTAVQRKDGTVICGDTDNGFGLLFNWNRLGDGEHTVVAYVDEEELDRAVVTVTTVGTGDEAEFLRDVAGVCVVADFPMVGQTTTLGWQQNSQNFVITDVE